MSATPPTYSRNPGQERMRALLTSGRRYCLVYGGSRSGKTFELVGTTAERALLAPGSRHLIVRQEAAAARRAIIKGTWPELVAKRWPGLAYGWNDQYGCLTIETSGAPSEIWVGGLNDEKAMERLLGNEYATIYINEASEVRYSAFTLLRTRLAQVAHTIEGKPLSQRFYADLNPTTREHWTYRLWVEGTDPEDQSEIDGDQFGAVVVNPMDNAANLSPEMLADLRSLPPRARKRFYEGQYVADAEDALWRRSLIQRVQNVPKLRRVVVAIDPAVTNEPGSDETGIIAAGLTDAGQAIVLDDASGRYSPVEWARQALALYDIYGADRIVAEVNQGGDMVENTIRSVRDAVPYRAVRASRGKFTRAEPVAAMYERGKVYHAGEFPRLEDQMCSFTVGFDRARAGYSPDRVDALVWAMTDLLPQLALAPDYHDEYDEPLVAGRNAVTGY